MAATLPDTLPEWASGTTAAVTEPSSGKKSQGWLAAEKPPHQYHNWLFNLIYLWIRFFYQALFAVAGEGGQHLPSGRHKDLIVDGTSGSPKVTIYGQSGEDSSTNELIIYQNEGGSTAFRVQKNGDAIASGKYTASSDITSNSGNVTGVTIIQSDATERSAVVAGVCGILRSSGTRIESTAGLGYDENDASARVIRYQCPQLPEHAVLTGVDVVTYHGNSGNSVDGTVYSVDNGVNSTRVNNGSIAPLTGVTGDQGSAVTLVGTMTQAGARGWYCDVEVTNNHANGVYVSKVVWSYTVARF